MADARERVGERVRTLREAAGLSQEQLALATGMSRNFVSSLERGLRNASVESLERLSKALRVTPAELLARESRTDAATRNSPEEKFGLRAQALAQGATPDDMEKALKLLKVFFSR